MKQALEGTAIESFVLPEPLKNIPHPILRGEIPEIKAKWDPDSNVIYSLDCPVAIGRPTTFKEVHSILFYISRPNPLGSSPARAENDAQFSRWEEGVAKWRLKYNEKNKTQPESPQYVGSLPIPECSQQNPEDLPKVSITEPNTTILTDSPTTIKVEVDSPKKIKEVRFIIDGKETTTRKPDEPLSAQITFDSQFSGRKTVLIMAITEDNLIGRAHRTFIINPDDSPPSIVLHTPQNNTLIQDTSFPVTAKVTATDSSGIDLIDVLYTKEGESGTKRIGRTNNAHSTIPNRYEITWPDSPGPGTYTVYAIAYDKTGNTSESTKHTISIK
jgi:hypothetical protein